MAHCSQDGGGGAGASPKEKKYSNNQSLRAVTVKQLYDVGPCSSLV